MTRRIPGQGDILLLSLDPTLGTEIRGERPVMVLSNKESNRQGRALVAPITQGGQLERIRGWTTTLMGCGCHTQGAAVISQSRYVDFTARHARHVETVPREVIEDALARLQAALEPDTPA